MDLPPLSVVVLYLPQILSSYFRSREPPEYFNGCAGLVINSGVSISEVVLAIHFVDAVLERHQSLPNDIKMEQIFLAACIISNAMLIDNAISFNSWHSLSGLSKCNFHPLILASISNLAINFASELNWNLNISSTQFCATSSYIQNMISNFQLQLEILGALSVNSNPSISKIIPQYEIFEFEKPLSQELRQGIPNYVSLLSSKQIKNARASSISPFSRYGLASSNNKKASKLLKGASRTNMKKVSLEQSRQISFSSIDVAREIFPTQFSSKLLANDIGISSFPEFEPRNIKYQYFPPQLQHFNTEGLLINQQNLLQNPTKSFVKS
jgi:hypothetical protein